LSFETKENILHIRGAGSHFQIVTSSPEDFPPVPLMEGPPDYSLEHGVLRRLVEWTAFAVARESSRYAINGILWQMERDHLMLVATDGRRLSWAQGKVTSRREGEIGQAIIPGKAAALLGKFPSHEDVVVSVKVMENQVLLSTGGINLSSALVEGHFPRYQDVIPRDNNRIVELDTAEFQGALRRAALLTNEESKAVRLSLSDGELVLSSRVPEQGEASITMPVRYRGEPLEIGFNPVFLMDVLRVVHTESVQFALKESNRPGVVSAGDDFVYVVMPVSLSSA
jgi:DNA polymerase-3 subunit beta